MKKVLLLTTVLTITIILFSKCNKDDDSVQPQGVINAQMVIDALNNNDIKYARIYDYNTSLKEYDLIDEVKVYPTETFNVTSTFFCTNRTDTTYYNLEYLVYFKIPAATERIDLYFRFKSK